MNWSFGVYEAFCFCSLAGSLDFALKDTKCENYGQTGQEFIHSEHSSPFKKKLLISIAGKYLAGNSAIC